MLAFANYREVGPAPGGAGAADTSFITCRRLTRLQHLSREHQLLLGLIWGNNGKAAIGHHCSFCPVKLHLDKQRLFVLVP